MAALTVIQGAINAWEMLPSLYFFIISKYLGYNEDLLM